MLLYLGNEDGEFQRFTKVFPGHFVSLIIFSAYLASQPVGLFPIRLGEMPIATRQPDHRSCCHYEMAQG